MTWSEDRSSIHFLGISLFPNAGIVRMVINRINVSLKSMYHVPLYGLHAISTFVSAIYTDKVYALEISSEAFRLENINFELIFISCSEQGSLKSNL